MGYGVTGLWVIGVIDAELYLPQSYNNNPRVIITTVTTITTSSSVVDPRKKQVKKCHLLFSLIHTSCMSALLPSRPVVLECFLRAIW